MRDGAARTGPASESLQGRKPPEWIRVSVPRTLSYRGLKCAHNADVTARILLNGDLMFCAGSDFKRLGVAKIKRLGVAKIGSGSV